MASFYSINFIYNSIPSTKYDLHIYGFDTGVTEGVGGAGIELFTQRVNRKAKVYTLGRTQSPVLKFPVTFGSTENIPADIRSAIGKWLFGQSAYHKLQFLQDDLQSIWYNCYFTEYTPTYIGNLNFAFTATAVCDSPFAWSGPKKTVWTAKNYSAETKNIYINSADVDYLYPTIAFTLSGEGTSISIINTTDSATRTFAFTGLTPSHTITVDNDRQTITSTDSLELYPLSKFNKNWLRFVPGKNVLTLTGNLTSASITYNEPRKVGG